MHMSRNRMPRSSLCGNMATVVQKTLIPFMIIGAIMAAGYRYQGFSGWYQVPRTVNFDPPPLVAEALDGMASDQHMRVYTEQDLGVQRLRIPGQLNGTSGEVVLLHLTLVQQITNGSSQIVGYGFMEALSYVHMYYGGILLQSGQVTCLLQESAIRLYAAGTNEVISVFEISIDETDDDTWHQFGRPFWLHAKLPSSGHHPVNYDLRVLNWRRHAQFTMPTSTQALARGDGTSTASRPSEGWMARPQQGPAPVDQPHERLVFVFSPPFETKPENVIALLLGHIAWHRATFNITGYLMYLYPGYIADIASNAGLAKLQQEGFIQFILWDQQVTEHTVPGHAFQDTHTRSQLDNNASQFDRELPDGDKAMVYNHAILMTSNLGVTVMIADLDEFIATSAPQSAAELIRSCLAGGLSSTILKWRLINCVDCLGNEIEDWKAALQKAGGSDVPMETHPLRRYNLSSDEATYSSYGKSLLVPERTMLYRHHEGQAYRGGRHEGNSPCDAEMLHAKQMFSKRPFETAMKNYTLWQWPFNRLGRYSMDDKTF